MNIDSLLISKKNIYIVFLITLVVLTIPLIAMQFTNEVNWSTGDFIVAGALLSFFGYLYNVLTKPNSSRVKNIIIGLLVLGMFCFVWINLI